MKLKELFAICHAISCQQLSESPIVPQLPLASCSGCTGCSQQELAPHGVQFTAEQLVSIFMTLIDFALVIHDSRCHLYPLSGRCMMPFSVLCNMQQTSSPNCTRAPALDRHPRRMNKHHAPASTKQCMQYPAATRSTQNQGFHMFCCFFQSRVQKIQTQF